MLALASRSHQTAKAYKDLARVALERKSQMLPAWLKYRIEQFTTRYSDSDASGPESLRRFGLPESRRESRRSGR